MPTKTQKHKILKQRLCSCARTVSCVAFLVLTIIGVSSLVHAMQLSSVEHQNGIPATWQVASLGTPDTISIPITYWDQKMDPCDDENRQFEWVICGYYTAGALQGIVKPTLGSDGTPVAAFDTQEQAWNAHHDIFSANVTTANFYRWFHEVPGQSQKLTKDKNGNDLQVTFTRQGNTNTYTYGEKNVFPIDGLTDFSDNDKSSQNTYNGQHHNYHFTAHMRIPVKIEGNGLEKFEFSGDDDVWVFLNNQLVLDIGGLHEEIYGYFQIDRDASGNLTLSRTIESVNNLDGREALADTYADAMADKKYNDNLQDFLHGNSQKGIKSHLYSQHQDDITLNFKAGDVVNLDFFYAERSTSESNTKITISNMNWPISADSEVNCDEAGIVEGTEKRLVGYDTHITNRDTENNLILKRISSYITDNATYIDENGEEKAFHRDGFLPLGGTTTSGAKTLYYTTTPNDPASWREIEITPPGDDINSFTLAEPIVMGPNGSRPSEITNGDTLYFRFLVETMPYKGTITNTVAYYTELDGAAGVTWDNTELPYDATPDPEPPVEPEPEEPEDPDPTDPDPTEPEEPSKPDDTPNRPGRPTTPSGPTTPSAPDEPQQPNDTPNDNPNDSNSSLLPSLPSLPGDDDLVFWEPLGEVAYVPNTGVIAAHVAPIFEEYFAEVVLSQGFVLASLLIFSGSFATYFSLRRHLRTVNNASMRSSAVRMPKNIGNSLRDVERKAKKEAAKVAKTTKKTATKASKIAKKDVTKAKKQASKVAKATKKEAQKVAKTTKKAATTAKAKATRTIKTGERKLAKKLKK